MKFKDYYEILGVAREATQDQVKQAYRKLARKYHPAVSQMADAEARLKELGEACAVLKDPEMSVGQHLRLAGQGAAGMGGGAALALDLLDEIDALRLRLQCAGSGR